MNDADKLKEACNKVMGETGLSILRNRYGVHMLAFGMISIKIIDSSYQSIQI